MKDIPGARRAVQLPLMPIDAEDTGFISRWSRRKALVRQGAAVVEPVVPTLTASSVALPKAAGPAVTPPTPLPAPAAAPAPGTSAPAPPETTSPLTLADVAALDRDSDYSRFLARGVQPDVKNVALSKLFTDPHFNVMDGLDTYIDDYGKPDPLPPGMLRQMLQAHVLGLFDEEDKVGKAEIAPVMQPVMQPVCNAVPPTEPSADENSDLQLQPDDAAGCTRAEPGSGEDAGGELGRPGDGPHAVVPA